MAFNYIKIDLMANHLYKIYIYKFYKNLITIIIKKLMMNWFYIKLIFILP